MPRFTSQCTECAFEEEIRVEGGTHPPCSACQGPTIYLWRAMGQAHSIQTDEAFIGGLTIENLAHEPITVYSRQELAQEMHRHGAVQKIKYVPGDKYLTDWSKSIDPQTLANATALVSRLVTITNSNPPSPTLRVQTSTRIIES